MEKCLGCFENKIIEYGGRCYSCYRGHLKRTSPAERGIHSIDQDSVSAGRGDCTVCGDIDVLFKRGRFICREKKRITARNRYAVRKPPTQNRRLKLESWMASTFADQAGKCAICRSDKNIEDLVIDHDHSFPCSCTKRGACVLCVRGLLCITCNSGLGMFRDRTEYLNAAINYLNRPPAITQKTSGAEAATEV